MRCGWVLAEWLERLAVNGKVATVRGSISASSDTAESEGRQMKQCWIKYKKMISAGFRMRIRINLSRWIRIHIQNADPDPGGQNELNDPQK